MSPNQPLEAFEKAVRERLYKRGLEDANQFISKAAQTYAQAAADQRVREELEGLLGHRWQNIYTVMPEAKDTVAVKQVRDYAKQRLKTLTSKELNND